MENIDLNDWNEFPAAVADIRSRFGQRTIESDGKRINVENDVVFRGQADSDWKLETTLERISTERVTVQTYLRRATSIVNELETVSGRRWNLPDWPDVREKITSVQDSMRPILPCYEYLVYLRHHGYPSPLLDWSRSPYVAAYFALEQPNTAERCAVYAFIETPDGGKALTGGLPRIKTMGPYVTSHIRHVAQKAQYTIAAEWEDDMKSHFFCSHHSVRSSLPHSQDVLVKITIPRSNRIKALKQLEDYNINHYTLFQSEDGLVRSLAMRSLELDGT